MKFVSELFFLLVKVIFFVQINCLTTLTLKVLKLIDLRIQAVSFFIANWALHNAKKAF